MGTKAENYLITGGAGFIGTNLADHYLSQQKKVSLFDNFGRPGSRENARWLQQKHGKRITVVEGDIRRDQKKLVSLVENAEVLFHQAAQVAVTTSVSNPREDFEINALGTFNVLEAVRQSSSPPIVVYSSTNKVYGKMQDVEIVEKDGRYVYAGLAEGVPETRPLDFYSPYGCSKGSGDQYVIDYSRIYGLRTIVFRQSCIYGPHQFGIEDQGWVAWFAIRAMQNLPVTIYGDGKQVRDVLFVGDLIAAYDTAIECIAKTSGQAYNIGGGPENILSLLELVQLLQEHFGWQLTYSLAEWRPGDQLVYISDIRKAWAQFGWQPKCSVRQGLGKLVEWIVQNKKLFAHVGEPGALV